MSIANTSLKSLGFPKKIEEEIAPYILPETHPAHKVLTELALESFEFAHLRGEKGFAYFAHGSTAAVITHEKLPGLIVKVPMDQRHDRGLVRRAHGHARANQFLQEKKVKDFVVSRNWLFVRKCSAIDVEKYENFIKAKKELKQQGKYSSAYTKGKYEGYAIFKNSVLIVEERLDLIDEKEKEKTLSSHFDQKMIDTMEAFFLDVGEDDLNKSNIGLTRKDEVALYDIAYWSKRPEKRLQNGIFGFSRMYLYIPDELREYWAKKTISLLNDQAQERALFHVLCYQNEIESLIGFVQKADVERFKKRVVTELDGTIMERFESNADALCEPKEQKLEAVPQTPSFFDKLITIFHRS